MAVLLYKEAVAEYVARHEPEAVTEALNQLAKKLDTRGITCPS